MQTLAAWILSDGRQNLADSPLDARQIDCRRRRRKIFILKCKRSVAVLTQCAMSRHDLSSSRIILRRPNESRESVPDQSQSLEMPPSHTPQPLQNSGQIAAKTYPNPAPYALAGTAPNSRKYYDTASSPREYCRCRNEIARLRPESTLDKTSGTARDNRSTVLPTIHGSRR